MNRLALALLLSLGTVVSNSFARFAYALVLPAMRNDLDWSWSQAGALNTVNAVGYLIGAVLTWLLVDRVGNRALFCWGLLITAVAVLATGLSGDFLWLSAWRVVAGVAGAAVFICGGALASNVFPDDTRRATMAITVFYGGSGIGLVLCGIAIPLILAARGDAAWPMAWFSMGAVSVAMSVAAILSARRVAEPSTGATSHAAWPARRFVPALAAYVAFAFGYIGYMTFVIAWMREQGASTTDVMLVWSLLGIATLVAPLLWRVPFQRWTGARQIAFVLLVLAAGAGLPLVAGSLVAMLVSAALFGSTMFSVPAAMGVLVRRQVPSVAWGTAMAVFTIVFASGQVAGPVVTGWLADVYGSLRPGLALSVAVLVLGAFVALGQREREP